MFIVKSRSAAHAFIDIVRCTVGKPKLVGVIEFASPTPFGDAIALDRHVDRTLEAAEVISAAACGEARKGMPVAIDVHDPAIHAALAAMIALNSQWIETGEAAGCCVDATDIAEIQMTIQAALDLRDEVLQGGSKSGEIVGWKRFHVGRMLGTRVLPSTFARPRAGYNPEDETFSSVYAQL